MSGMNVVSSGIESTIDRNSCATNVGRVLSRYTARLSLPPLKYRAADPNASWRINRFAEVFVSEAFQSILRTGTG